jgi:hypothetical protein
MMDPADPRLVTGTPEQIDQARREFRRHQKLQIAMRSGLPEIPRSDLAFHKFGRIEDIASGNFFHAMRGKVTDPRHSPAVAYYVTEDATPIYVERPVGAPRTGPNSKHSRPSARAVTQNRRRSLRGRSGDLQGRPQARPSRRRGRAHERTPGEPLLPDAVPDAQPYVDAARRARPRRARQRTRSRRGGRTRRMAGHRWPLAVRTLHHQRPTNMAQARHEGLVRVPPASGTADGRLEPHHARARQGGVHPPAGAPACRASRRRMASSARRRDDLDHAATFHADDPATARGAPGEVFYTPPDATIRRPVGQVLAVR